jgi:hypothetical protein
MIRPELRPAMDALARRELPVRPGDLIQFFFSGNKLLVIQCDAQGPHPDGKSLNPGQNIGGLMSTTHHTMEVAVIWLDWAGYSTHWTIHRPVE